MTDITVVGLGAMGSAIAKTELQAGYNVTVWNRSAEKAKPLIDLRQWRAMILFNKVLTEEKFLSWIVRVIWKDML